MNIKGPKGRGAYSAIVYKDGDLYVAEDDVGTVIIENTDAATAIQKAIDDYAVNGLVLVKPNIALTTTLKILKGWSSIEFLGQIATPGVTAFELGDVSNHIDFCTLKVTLIQGVDKTAHGIVFKNATANRIFFNQIVNCDIGLYFDPVSGGYASENMIEGYYLSGFGTAAIRLSSSPNPMEGNHFVTSTFDSPIGFEAQSGGINQFQTYIGVIDCAEVAGSEDIKDATGGHVFLCDFVRRDTCTICKDTVVTNALGALRGFPGFENRNGFAELLNIGFTPLLMWDFNRDSVADWTLSNCSMSTPSKSTTRITASAADPQIIRDILIDGGQASVVIVRYKYVSGDKGEVAKLFYKTAGHDFNASYFKYIPNLISDGEWHVLAWDMSKLDAGGSDWIDNTITRIRYDYSTGTAVYDIDYIAIGTHGYGTIYNMDDALKTPASAGAVGNKGDRCWDANYIYICTAADTWKRVAIATW